MYSGASASRLFQTLTTQSHYEAVIKLKRFLSKFNDIELLLQIGEYSAGSDKVADAAIAAMPAIEAFLRQKTNDPTPFDKTLQRLHELF